MNDERHVERVEVVHRITLNAEEAMLAARALRLELNALDPKYSVGEIVIATALAERLEAVS